MTGFETLTTQLGTLSYVGIFGVSLLANVFIPVPEEIVVLAIGYAAGTGHINGYVVVPIIILGLLISDTAIYFLAKNRNKFITGFYNKLFANRAESKRDWINSHIEHVIFFSRFLMQLRFLGPFFAGQTKTSLRKFYTYELAALVLYVPFLVWAGGYFQNRINEIVNGIGLVRNIVVIIIGIILLFSLFRFINNKFIREKI